MQTHIALNIARDRGLDLVEISPQAKPPVCKIIDYGKYKYEQSKREAEARKKQVKVAVKEVKLTIGIADHDFNTKLKQIRTFLERGDRVKVLVWFRGREIARPELGKTLLIKLAANIEDIGYLDQQPRLFGRAYSMFVIPGKKNK